jgi:molybdopterin-guanine dinucleotide biosynthesis protein A
MHPQIPIRGLILAGGAGRRVGNRDKGLLYWRGKPLIAHVVERLRNQVDQLYISCNRNTPQYRHFGLPLLQDLREGYQGPLAGLESAIGPCGNSYLIVAPCDTPLLPEDLVPRLMQSVVGEEQDVSDISYVTDGVREHYLCAAMRPGILASVSAQLDAGDRSVRAWYARLNATAVDFSDQPGAFKNINHMD